MEIIQAWTGGGWAKESEGGNGFSIQLQINAGRGLTSLAHPSVRPPSMVKDYQKRRAGIKIWSLRVYVPFLRRELRSGTY